jgi:hypothetical protein
MAESMSQKAFSMNLLEGYGFLANADPELVW